MQVEQLNDMSLGDERQRIRDKMIRLANLITNLQLEQNLAINELMRIQDELDKRQEVREEVSHGTKTDRSPR